MNGSVIRGKCSECGCWVDPVPMRKHDARWCGPCDIWLEPPCCDGGECDSGFGGRPEKPSMVEDKRSWDE